MHAVQTKHAHKNMAANNEDEEPDYMSDIFITEDSSTSSSSGTRHKGAPVAKRSQVKRLQKEKEKRTRKKKAASEFEQQLREEGLSKPLSVDNKGYSLLCKMGYVHGKTLGKSGGLVDPLPVTVKEGRLGLGRDEHVKDLQEKIIIAKEKQVQDFRSHCLSQSTQRQVKSDLRKSRQVSEHLDTQKLGFTEPIAYWYWLSTFEEQLEEEEEEEEELPSEEEQLSILTDYLRSEYYYCLWCGMEYSSEEVMLQECPGNSWQAHN